MDIEAKVAVSAAIGGTAAAIGGGKPVRPVRGGFATGAITDAYVVLFNHLAQHGSGGDEPTKKGGGYVKDRESGLNFLEQTAEQEQVEVSMYELETGEYFVNPWEGNSIDESHQNFEVRSDGIYHDGSRIVAQYHYGPAKLGYSSEGGYNDMQFAHRYNVTVFHISSKYVYRFSPKELWYWIDPPTRFMAKDQFYNK